VSYFDDYIADGLCCECCGGLIDMDEPGYSRLCAGCARPVPAKPSRKAKRGKR